MKPHLVSEFKFDTLIKGSTEKVLFVFHYFFEDPSTNPYLCKMTEDLFLLYNSHLLIHNLYGRNKKVYCKMDPGCFALKQ